MRWSGAAYLDANAGDEPIERPFRRWDWSRATLGDGRTAVIYDVIPREGERRVVTRVFYPDGRHEAFDAPILHRLPRTAWGIARSTRGDQAGVSSRVVGALEDTPFYVRDLVEGSLLGESVVSVHETLDTNRLRAWPIRLMLPFRMPRRS